MVKAREMLPLAVLAAALYILARPAPRVEAAPPTVPPPPPPPVVAPPTHPIEVMPPPASPPAPTQPPSPPPSPPPPLPIPADAIGKCIAEDGIPVVAVQPDTDVSPYVLDGLRPAGGYYIKNHTPDDQFREGNLKWSVDVFSARGYEGYVSCFSKIYPKELPSTCICPEGYTWDRWAGMCCSKYGCVSAIEDNCFRHLTADEAKKYFPQLTITEGCDCYVPCGRQCLWYLFPVGWTCGCR